MAKVKFEEKKEKFVSISGMKDEDGNIIYLLNGKVWARDFQLPIEVLEEKKPGKYIKENATEIHFAECVHEIGDTATDIITGAEIVFKTKGTQYKLLDIVF